MSAYVQGHMRQPLWHWRVGHTHDATPIVLVPGAMSVARDWPRTMVEELARTHDVLGLDLRQMGRNAWSDTGEYTLTDMAEDVLWTLLVHRVSRFHLVGMSMGGAVAQEVALRHPERVASLSLLMSTPGRGIWDQGLARPNADVLRAMRTEFELHVRGETQRALVHRQRHLSAVEDVPLVEMERRATVARRHGFNPFASHGRAFACSPPRTGRLHNLTAPTLLVHGRDDPLLDASHSRMMHDLLPDSRLHQIRGMGHYISEANGARVGALIRRHAQSK